MLIPPAYAQAGGTAAQSPLAGVISFAPLILIFVLMWVMIIRPQQRRAKALQTAVNAVKKGDSVVTGGGVLGKVTRVEDQYVEVEIAPNTRIRVVKATIAEVTAPNTKPAND